LSYKQLEIMAKNKNKSMKITIAQILIMERAVRRNVDIELGMTSFKHKVHKTTKQYNRKEGKQISYE
jgi:hypothetical protein